MGMINTGRDGVIFVNCAKGLGKLLHSSKGTALPVVLAGGAALAVGAGLYFACRGIAATFKHKPSS